MIFFIRQIILKQYNKMLFIAVQIQEESMSFTKIICYFISYIKLERQCYLTIFRWSLTTIFELKNSLLRINIKIFESKFRIII